MMFGHILFNLPDASCSRIFNKLYRKLVVKCCCGCRVKTIIIHGFSCYITEYDLSRYLIKDEAISFGKEDLTCVFSDVCVTICLSKLLLMPLNVRSLTNISSSADIEVSLLCIHRKDFC